MKLKGILALVGALVLVSFAKPAAAGVHLEPYVGYGMGSWEMPGQSEDFTGMAYGGRLGYTMLGFGGGVEYMGGSFKDKADVDPSTFKPKALGVWVGYTFPVMIRAYGTYFFDGKTTVSDSSGDSELTGSGMKLGVGFTALPFLSVNLEYFTNTWDEIDGTALPGFEVTAKGYMLTLSIPLDI